MGDLIREERYIFLTGVREHVLRVQELVSGSTTWPERFRIYIPASHSRNAERFYGTTALQVLERATEYLSFMGELEPAQFWLHGRLN